MIPSKKLLLLYCLFAFRRYGSAPRIRTVPYRKLEILINTVTVLVLITFTYCAATSDYIM
jgi:hypothetical protein